MEFRICLLCLVFAMLQSCCAGRCNCLFVCLFTCLFTPFYVETIDVTLPPSPLTNFQYTLDTDPREREYNCLDANNNTDIFWRDSQLFRLTNPFNINSVYRSNKKLGVYEFKCYNGNGYLGVIGVDILGKCIMYIPITIKRIYDVICC